MNLETSQEVDQEIDGRIKWGRMEEAPENGKESLHSTHANGINEFLEWLKYVTSYYCLWTGYMFMEWQHCLRITCLFNNTVSSADCNIQWLVKLNNLLYRPLYTFRYYPCISLKIWSKTSEKHDYKFG
jgi:hypothetical protein